jgi:hypothetical protein
VIFPGPEVADVAGAAEAGGPGSIGFHYGLIQADGEEDQFFLLAFFLDRRFNLFYPRAADRAARP